MLKKIGLPDKPAFNKNDGRKSASSRNNNSRPAFGRNNSNSEVDRFDISRNGMEYIKSQENCLSYKNRKVKKCLSLKIWLNLKKDIKK